ncbi:hypothetical protein GCM10023080_029220 [Streptomyces pseudoechinosporeus]
MVSGLTFGEPRSARETVCADTPAVRATSAMLGCLSLAVPSVIALLSPGRRACSSAVHQILSNLVTHGIDNIRSHGD